MCVSPFRSHQKEGQRALNLVSWKVKNWITTWKETTLCRYILSEYLIHSGSMATACKVTRTWTKRGSNAATRRMNVYDYGWMASLHCQNELSYSWVGLLPAGVQVVRRLAGVGARRVEAQPHHVQDVRVRLLVLLEQRVRLHDVDFAIRPIQFRLGEQAIHIAFQFVIFDDWPVAELLYHICRLEIRISVDRTGEMNETNLPSDTPVLATHVSCIGFAICSKAGGGYCNEIKRQFPIRFQ